MNGDGTAVADAALIIAAASGLATEADNLCDCLVLGLTRTRTEKRIIVSWIETHK